MYTMHFEYASEFGILLQFVLSSIHFTQTTKPTVFSARVETNTQRTAELRNTPTFKQKERLGYQHINTILY